MFERPHHRRIAALLGALDADLLAANACWFGGGTAMALRYGEYRESVDIDFLVSETRGYRALRERLTGLGGVQSIARPGALLEAARDVRADQYGIRTMLRSGGIDIKFEIVSEGRIALQVPGAADNICGVAALTPLDMAASKLLANSDRWADDGVFSRDLIDLAMMKPALPLLRRAADKAEGAYGDAIRRDLQRAIDRMSQRTGWLERCMQAMGMADAPAQVWQRIRALRRVLA